MKQRYDVILFDADRTLFDFDQSQRLALGEVYRANGIAETEENLRTYVHLNDQLWARFDKGEISLEELEYVRFRSFTEALGLTNLDANQLNGQYIEALGRNSILMPGAEALCKALAPYCQQYIVTNGIKEAQEGRLERSPIRQYIRKMYISGVMGVRKPERAYFELVYKDLHMTWERWHRTVIVGDGLSSDIQGGVNGHLDTIWYNPKHKPNDTGICPTWEADSFDTVKAVILGQV